MPWVYASMQIVLWDCMSRVKWFEDCFFQNAIEIRMKKEKKEEDYEKGDIMILKEETEKWKKRKNILEKKMTAPPSETFIISFPTHFHLFFPFPYFPPIQL